MKTTSVGTQTAWAAAFKGGTTAAVTRAVISRPSAHFTPYDLSAVRGTFQTGAKVGAGNLCSIVFDQDDQPVELPNVESMTWTRGDSTDAATATLVLTNSEVLPAGEVPVGIESVLIDRPGFFTATRGTDAAAATRWGHVENGWRGMLVADNMIRSFEGYGTDGPSVAPESDTQLSPSGVWFIDDVTVGGGKITIEMRDAGRWLIDLLTLPPVIPMGQYPLSWEAYNSVANPPVISTSLGKSWFRPTYVTDSNIPYIGKGYTDGALPYVDSRGGVLGHRGIDAFDKVKNSYWLSVGNYPNWSSAFEYVQGKFSARSVAAVRVQTWGGPYKVYVSIQTAAGWQGRRKIPYTARQVNTGADILFVTSAIVKKNGLTEIQLPAAIANATGVRITFTDLYDSGIGQFQYRAGCYDVEVLAGTSVTTSTSGGTTLHGNYGDYTDIVKWMCAWGGLHWPLAATNRISDDTVLSVAPSSTDTAVLPTGRAWGDFELTGTTGVVNFDSASMDKRPLMDVISQIRDIIGFTFVIDEVGGAIWRSPNVWSVGNYLWQGGPNGGRTSTLIVIDDETTLLDIKQKTSSRGVRDYVFISDASGKYGSVSGGYNPNPTGMIRVGGWTDQNFGTLAECQIMGDLIALKQSFEYETFTISIPGNPAIQVDDQIRVYDQETSQTGVLRVTNIKSSFNKRSGRFTYDLTVHWLGETPGAGWIVDKSRLAAATVMYLQAQGKI